MGAHHDTGTQGKVLPHEGVDAAVVVVPSARPVLGKPLLNELDVSALGSPPIGIDTMGSEAAGVDDASDRDAMDEAREEAPPVEATPMSGSGTGGVEEATAGAGPASSGGHSQEEVPVAVL